MVPKPDPLMVRAAPLAPLAGVKLEIFGEARTVKSSVLITLTPLVVKEILLSPTVAPAGTVVVMEVAFAVKVG